MTDQPSNIVPFGKYKGRLIEEVLADDPGYLQWLAGQEWFRSKFAVLYQVIINRGAEAEETPDHNAMQVKFLDDEFCLRFMRHYRPNIDELARNDLQERLDLRTKNIEKKLAERKREAECEQDWIERAEKWERGDRGAFSFDPGKSVAEYRASLRAIEVDISLIEAELTQQRNAQLGDITFRFKREFEDRGIDVVLEVCAVSAAQTIETWLWGHYGYSQDRKVKAIAIELKPNVGDDYPAVLRQMKANGSGVLFVGDYTGQGATQEQFVKTMATAGIRVVFAREVEST